MGENGRRDRNKRERDRDRDRDRDGDHKNQRRRGNERDDRNNHNHNHNHNNNNNNRDKSEHDELVVYRILCPDRFIGSVIGKSGKVINSIRQDTRAKVKVVDPFPGSKNRVITIYSYIKEKREIEPDEELGDLDPVCHAQDALLRVHNAIANVVGSAGDSDKKWKDKEECQILVPSSQSANLIGKSGTTIKKLRSKTRANVKVSPKDVTDPNHSCAMDYDNFVQITGEPEAVKKALLAVSTIMYKFPPKEAIPLETSVPEIPPTIIIPSDLPIYPSAGLYPNVVEPYVPSRPHPSVLTASHAPELQGYADSGHTWPIYSSTLPVVSGYPGAGLSGELTIRVLCPFTNIGRIIGRGGASIRSVREASGARIDVDDTRRDECIITISATESLDDVKSMAVEAVLLLQGKINEEDEENVSIRLLVPSKVIGCIIGKSGSIINEIRKRTRADVRISKSDIPKCADANDELVEVIGEVGNVRDALVQIVLRLRDDVLKDRDSGHTHHNPSSGNDSMYAGAGGLPVPSVLPSVSSVTPLGYDHRPESGLRSSSYAYGSLPISEDRYGSLSSYSSKQIYGRLPAAASEMLIPGHAVGKVMGKGGANVDNIRKISGASVEISETNSSRGDRVAVISGTSEQKRAAENLIQAFIMAT